MFIIVIFSAATGLLAAETVLVLFFVLILCNQVKQNGYLTLLLIVEGAACVMPFFVLMVGDG